MYHNTVIQYMSVCPTTSSAAIEWCNSYIEKENWSISSKWPGSYYYFYFKDPADATLFCLNWIH